MPVTCRAILFDFDGVIVNSDPVYERHWEEWAAAHGVSFEHIISIHHGLPAVQTISTVAPHMDAVFEADQFMQRCIDDLEGTLLHDGVADILEAMPAGRWAIATSSYHNIVTRQLDHTGLPKPPVLVTIEDVDRGKPAPDPYMLAAERLGFAPADCLVIEDSPTGVKAAKAAGAFVIAVQTTQPAAVLAEADLIVKRITDLEITAGEDGIEVGWPEAVQD